jgi:lambda family phage portal protein
VTPSSTFEAYSGYGYGYGWHDTSHSGASYHRKQLSNWRPSQLPADIDLLPDLPTLVSRSRDLHRNNGVAAASLQTLQDNVAGTGLRLASWPDYRALGKTKEWAMEWSTNVEALWRTWASTTACDVANEMTFDTMTQLVFRSGVENGEAIALGMWMERPNTPYRTCIQLVESDRLSNPFGTPPSPAWQSTGTMGIPIGAGAAIIGGVEKDVFGKPIAYYIRKAPLWLGGWAVALSGGPEEWERIPAETDWGRKRVLHMHSKERIGQSRGRPILTPVIEQFRMLDSYQRTELQSAIVNALVAGVIETPVDPMTLIETMGGNANTYLENKNEYRVQLEGGSMIPLYPGDKMTPFMPARPAAQFSQFVEAISRQIGAALGLPYELALKDFSKTNYSSARAALLEAWRFFTVRRAWLAAYWAGPVYRLWLEEAINMGQVEAPDFYEKKEYYWRSKWIGMGRGWIDPVKEAEAAQLRMQTMISTLENECAEQGQDWNEVLEQRRIEQDRMKELGLEIPVLAVSGIKETPEGATAPVAPSAAPAQPQEAA